MIAAVLQRPKTIELLRTPLPLVKDNEVKIRVEGCGICASSLPIWEGREWFSYPMEPGSPGHEAWGVIDAIGGEVEGFSPGDRVAFLSGHGYAEFDIANTGSLVKLPKELDGQPFPAEPLGCAMNIFQRSEIRKGDTVAIIGIGFLGALLCQLAKHAGAKVIAISRREFSLGFASSFGADEILPFTEAWEVAQKVSEITGGDLCSRVIEATGKQEAIDIATEIISERGRMIIAGYHQDGLRQVNFQKWNWKGIDVINAHEREAAIYLKGMQSAVNAVVEGIIRPQELYTDILPLAEIEKGFERTAQRPDGFMKALIQL
jgi:threonine dehydrogenase-like Zn-dependent dehydrogenase